MSWTPEIELARNFANSYSVMGDKHLYKTVVPPESILGIIEGNSIDPNGNILTSGKEYVINHQTLENVEQIE